MKNIEFLKNQLQGNLMKKHEFGDKILVYIFLPIVKTRHIVNRASFEKFAFNFVHFFLF